MSYRYGKHNKPNQSVVNSELEKIFQEPPKESEPKDDWNPDWDAPIPDYARAQKRIAELQNEDLSAPPPEKVDKEKEEAEIKAKRELLNISKREQTKQSWDTNISPWGNSFSSFGQSSPFIGWPSGPSQDPSGWGGASAQGPVTSFGGWGGAPAQGPATSFPGWGGGYSQPNPFGNINSQDRSGMNQADQSMYNETNQEYSSFGEGKYETASEADFTDDVYRRTVLNPENNAEREDLLNFDDDGDSDSNNNHLFFNDNISSKQGDEDDGDNDQDEYTQKEDARDHIFGQGPLSSRPRGPFKSSFKDLFSDNEGELTYNQNMATMKGAGSFQNSVGKNTEGSTNSQTMPTMTGTGTDVVAEGTAQTPAQRPRKQLKEEFMKDREELEKKMNAKDDSIHTRGNEPLPAHLAPPPAPYEGGFGGPEGFQGSIFGGPPRGIMTADQIQAEMALQKLARIAIKAARSRKKGRKGKTPVVFI